MADSGGDLACLDGCKAIWVGRADAKPPLRPATGVAVH